tara:strand:- start:604 stop:921 length:318 start_codon:yes stop_codon:yes gene_type:complete
MRVEIVYENSTNRAIAWTGREKIIGTLTDNRKFIDCSSVIWDIDLPSSIVPDGYLFDDYFVDIDNQTLEMRTQKKPTTPKSALEAKLADDSITFEEMKELMRLRG